MRKIVGSLMAALSTLVALPASVQFKFDIKGDVNISSIRFSSDVPKANNIAGFQVGLMIKTTLSLVGVGTDAAVLYSQKGLKATSVGGAKTPMKTDYVDVLVNLKWRFGSSIVKAYLAAGPYIGLRVGGDKFWDIPGSVVDQAKVKNFSADPNFGAGMELTSYLQVDFNYGLGLADNYSAEKVNLSDGVGKNREWSIMVAILF